MSEENEKKVEAPKKRYLGGNSTAPTRPDDGRFFAPSIIREEKLAALAKGLSDLIHDPKAFRRYCIEQRFTPKEWAHVVRSEVFDDYLTAIIGMDIAGVIDVGEKTQRSINMLWKRFGKIQNIQNFFTQRNTIEKVVMREATPLLDQKPGFNGEVIEGQVQ